MNLVIDECVEMATHGPQNNSGMVNTRKKHHHVRSLGTSMNNGCVPQRNQLLPCVPSPHFTMRKNWVVYIFLLNFFVLLQ